MASDGWCRDCFTRIGGDDARCPHCCGPRLLRHPEIDDLAIAHVDCDAFYASVEKRDAPELADRPLIVGGGRRGVVATACYLARAYGVRSAMPMFKARAACPDAVVVKPRMSVYVAESRRIREMFDDVTPLVEPISIDEAFLDLTGTERLHGSPPALTLMRLQRRIEEEVGVTVSVGLSFNKFLAKSASDLDKPRGFAVVGRGRGVVFPWTTAGKRHFRRWPSVSRASWRGMGFAQSPTCGRARMLSSRVPMARRGFGFPGSRAPKTIELCREAEGARAFPQRQHSTPTLPSGRCWRTSYGDSVCGFLIALRRPVLQDVS